MDKVKTVAPVAHDNRKSNLTEWVAYNAGKLAKHHLVCTGTTGRMVEETLAESDQAPQSLRITVSISTGCGTDPQYIPV